MSRRRRVVVLLLLLIVALFVIAVVGVSASARGSIGAAPTSARLERMRGSPQWRGHSFRNPLERIDGPWTAMVREWIFGGQPHRTPSAPIPVQTLTRDAFVRPPESGLRVTWLGHSTMLLEIDGATVLVDPVWGERASPFSWAGPQRFFAPPLPLEELPNVDVVVISHDHYDHLDTPTVKALVGRELRWIVPLGVGAHLESWGVPPERMSELDWWERVRVGELDLVATPARHFSGRWLDDADRTLWAGWAILGPTHRVFYSGDTALHPSFIDIGERLGPFDLTFVEVGAYDALWADVHLGPEQAVRAHRLVKGDVLLPVHWGLFDLALHGWTEPMERTLAAATLEGVRVLAPRPGESLEPTRDARAPDDVTRWWPGLPWRTVDVAPAFSSGVDALWRETAPR